MAGVRASARRRSWSSGESCYRWAQPFPRTGGVLNARVKATARSGWNKMRGQNGARDGQRLFGHRPKAPARSRDAWRLTPLIVRGVGRPEPGIVRYRRACWPRGAVGRRGVGFGCGERIRVRNGPVRRRRHHRLVDALRVSLVGTPVSLRGTVTSSLVQRARHCQGQMPCPQLSFSVRLVGPSVAHQGADPVRDAAQSFIADSAGSPSEHRSRRCSHPRCRPPR